MHRRTTTFRITKLPLALAIGLIGLMTDAHAATVCQSEKGAGYPWAWRQIDGKRCWYKGNAGMDKKLLRWAENTPAPRAASASASASASTPTPKRRTPSTIESYGEQDQLLHSYWPPLPPSDVFGDRFDALRGQRQ